MAGRMLIDIAQLRALDECTSVDELSAAVTAIVTGLDIDYWLYAFEPPLVSDHPSPLHMGTYPQAWIERYLQMAYVNIDPVVSYCHDHAIPLPWDNAEDPGKRIVDPHLQRVRNLFGEAREFGLGTGVSVPLHGPGVCWALMSYASRDRPGADLHQLLPELHLLAYYVHEVGRRFARTRTAAPLPVLTKRERECLSWAAEGKTSWEIGQLLNISERTSIFHLQNATHKLGVSGRQAAIARAISMGLIVSIRS